MTDRAFAPVVRTSTLPEATCASHGDAATGSLVVTLVLRGRLARDVNRYAELLEQRPHEFCLEALRTRLRAAQQVERDYFDRPSEAV